MKGNRGSDNSLLIEKGIKFTHANGSIAYAEPGTKMAAELRKEGYFPGSIASGESREKTIEELEAEDYASGMEDVPSEVQATKDWIRKDSTIRVPTQKGKNIIFTNANGSYAFAEPGTDEADALLAQQYFPGSIAAKNAGKKFQPAPHNKNGMMTGGEGEFNSSRNSMMGDWNNDDRSKQYGTNVPYTRDTSFSDTAGRVENYRFPNKNTNYTEQFNANGVGSRQVIKSGTEKAPINNFGYHKRPGQNFWTINNDDPYWDTHDMEGSSAFEEAPLKQQPQQELDWSYFKNLLNGGK
jgi:hypothetical protein